MKFQPIMIMAILGIVLLSTVCAVDCSSGEDIYVENGTIDTSDKLVLSMMILFVYAPLIITLIGAICLLVGFLSGRYPLISFGMKAFAVGLILMLIQLLSVILLGTTVPWWSA